MGPCEIHRKHAHTIGPDGALYACPGFAGDAKSRPGTSTGAAKPARPSAASRFDALAAWKQCHDCAFIPVCAGGCTVAAHTELGRSGHAELSQDELQAGSCRWRARQPRLGHRFGELRNAKGGRMKKPADKKRDTLSPGLSMWSSNNFANS